MADNVFDLATRSLAAGLLLLLGACGGRGEDPLVVPAGTPTATALASGPGVAAPVSAAEMPSSPVAPTVATLREHIAALERGGVVWSLDRSSDIAGPDANRNGVRDDVEAWVHSRPVSDIQRKALMQTARALQSTLLVDLMDDAALTLRGERLMAAANCGGSSFVPATTYYGFAGKLEAMTANTRERAKRYMDYNSARSGSSATYPAGDTCEP